MFKGSNQFGLFPIKGLKERLSEHFENTLNRDKVTGKDIEENEKVCDALDGKEECFFL